MKSSKEYLLEEIASFRRGSFPQPYGLDKWYDDQSGMPFVQVYDVGNNGKLKHKTKRKISKEAAPFSVFAPKGTIIITIQGSIGKVAITQYDAYIDRTLLVIESFKIPLIKDFFAFILKELFDMEKNKADGGIIKTINKENLSKFKIKIPESLEEQKRVAEILTCVDNNIDITEQKIKKLEMIKEGMLEKLFNKGLGKNKLKDSELGLIPENWNILSLEEMGNDIIRGASPRPQGDPRYYGGNVPRLMGADVSRDGKVTIPKIDFLTEAGAKLSRFLPKGTLVITCSGDVAVPTFLGVDCCIHDGFIAFKQISELIDNRFLYYFFLKFKKELEKVATDGGIFVNLTTSLIKETKLALPPKEEQIQIVSILEKIDENIDVVKLKKEKLEQLKKGLLNELL